MPRCWCGNTSLMPFSPAYERCPVCETLVVMRMPGMEIARVTDDKKDLYGETYWTAHQEHDLGNADITTRARTDLPERGLYWLRTLLKYKLPPARTLELGSAHGGFVAMLRWAGFEATGIELSPWVVEFSRRTFDVPILQGPVEDQRIAQASLDVVVLMDVLEHLPDPVGTMRHCLSLLKSDGVLVIQTPSLPEGKTYDEMMAQGDRFLEMLQEKEHLYLFSRRSIREFFGRLGAHHVEFEPALFAHYDMFLVVSRAPLVVHPPEAQSRALSATAGGRMLQALLDADDQHRALQQRYDAAEADRVARLEVIERQAHEMTQLQAQVHHWLEEHQDLYQQLLGAIARREEDIAQLQGQAHHWLQESQRLATESQRLATESQRLATEQATLRQHFEAAEADRAARLTVIEQQGKEIAHLQAQVHHWLHIVQAVAQTRIYRVLRRLGRWKFMEQGFSRS